MKFEKLVAGAVVYDVGRTKMGNTNATTVGTWSVRIVSVDSEKRSVVASWNGNAPRTFFEHNYKKWRPVRPMLVRSGFGQRLATREEQKQAAAAL